MGWKQIKELSKEEFRRLTGVQKPTFEKMIAVLREAQRQKTLQGGRPSKLSLEDRLLMSLEYLREYRTYFHIGKHYGLGQRLNLLNPCRKNESYSNVYTYSLCRNRYFKRKIRSLFSKQKL